MVSKSDRLSSARGSLFLRNSIQMTYIYWYFAGFTLHLQMMVVVGLCQCCYGDRRPRARNLLIYYTLLLLHQRNELVLRDQQTGRRPCRASAGERHLVEWGIDPDLYLHLEPLCFVNLTVIALCDFHSCSRQICTGWPLVWKIRKSWKLQIAPGKVRVTYC